MPYLTPQDLPEDDDCRPLSIPASSEWLALFGGALTELTLKWNWEDSGGLSIEDTLAKMNEIIDAWYSTPCDHCELPEGGRVIRIGDDGRIQELDETGNWSAGTGDYYIPPPDAREGGTPEDQICLAAKNATNVLEQLYESLSESWGSSLSEAEALTDFTTVLVGVVGFAFAPITAGIAAFFFVVFTLLYDALEYLGADLWDEAFSDQMICFLVNCASNDEGVVTFDWDCFTGELNSLANDFLLSETQLRLYLQVSYILYFIGGVDGLNLAGGTTEITDDDCPCDCEIELYDSCGYATIENIGGIRWRVTSGSGAGGQAACVSSVGDACWGYKNWEMISGTVTFANGTSCAEPISGWMGSCDESHITGVRTDCIGQFLFSNAGSFVYEMDVICHEDC